MLAPIEESMERSKKVTMHRKVYSAAVRKWQASLPSASSSSGPGHPSRGEAEQSKAKDTGRRRLLVADLPEEAFLVPVQGLWKRLV